MDLLQSIILFFASSNPEPLLLAVLVFSTIIVVDRAARSAQRRGSAAGLAPETPVVSIDGGKALAVREYVSEIQGLAGRPDALIRENGFVIPIERKPLARKLRDRHVAQLLVYMRLIEEFEGKKPPYGYLILGPNCRRVKIFNSPERQAWLQGLIGQMRAIRAGGAAAPDPHPKKCRQCGVRQWCSSRADEADCETQVRQTRDPADPFVQIAGRGRSAGRAA